MKLISMTYFVIYQYEKLKNKEINTLDYAFNTSIYAHFLKKPLKLGYFIPCDENDVPLEEPKRWKDYLDFPESFDGNKEWYELYAYQEAKKRVLFEYQWEFQSWNSSDMENSRIEDLLSDELIYTLTATAKKEIGL